MNGIIRFTCGVVVIVMAHIYWQNKKDSDQLHLLIDAIKVQQGLSK